MSLPYAGQLGGTREYVIAPTTMSRMPSVAHSTFVQRQDRVSRPRSRGNSGVVAATAHDHRGDHPRPAAAPQRASPHRHGPRYGCGTCTVYTTRVGYAKIFGDHTEALARARLRAEQLSLAAQRSLACAQGRSRGRGLRAVA
jgi:hypothetical protein